MRPSATSTQIKTAYRSRVREVHPDVSKRSNSTALFLEVQRAYETLSHAPSRQDYDQTIAVRSGPTTSYAEFMKQAWQTGATSYSGQSASPAASYSSRSASPAGAHDSRTKTKSRAAQQRRSGQVKSPPRPAATTSCGDFYASNINNFYSNDGQRSSYSPFGQPVPSFHSRPTNDFDYEPCEPWLCYSSGSKDRPFGSYP